MGHQIVIVPPTDTVDELQERVRGKEVGGFQLVTLGLGFVGDARAILATYLQRGFGDAPPPLVLKDIGAGAIQQQETDVTNQETEGMLISYAGVLLSGRETNVAVYRKKE